MRNSFNFIKDNLLKIKPPKTEREVYKDTKEKGLILMVSYYLYKLIGGKPSCLIPENYGVLYNDNNAWRKELWDKYYMLMPEQRRRPSRNTPM